MKCNKIINQSKKLKFSWVTIILFLVIPMHTVNAQNGEFRKCVIKVNVVNLAFGAYNVGFEYMLQNNLALKAYGRYHPVLAGREIESINVGVGLRYFIIQQEEEKLQGLYIDGVIDYLETGEENDRVNLVQGGPVIGYQWEVMQKLLFDVGGGVKYNGVFSDDNDKFGSFDFDRPAWNLWPSYNASVGIRF